MSVLQVGRELKDGGKIISLIPEYHTTHVIVEYPDTRLAKIDAHTAEIYLQKTQLEEEFEQINLKVREAIDALTEVKVMVEKRGANQKAWLPLDVEDYSLWRPLMELVEDTLYWTTSSHRCSNPE